MFSRLKHANLLSIVVSQYFLLSFSSIVNEPNSMPSTNCHSSSDIAFTYTSTHAVSKSDN